MRKVFTFVLMALLIALAGYAASGYIAAAADADDLKYKAQNLIDSGRGGNELGDKRLRLLLMVQDPKFYGHEGVDLKTAGAGITTVTQSLAKRLAFDDFKKGIGKIRQTTYAMSLEKHLTKDEILALFLSTLPMGQGPDGWTIGFFTASQSFYGGTPSEISEDEFIELIAVMIAPGQLNHITRNELFKERLKRIGRLRNGDCEVIVNNDVWFEACAAGS